PQGEFFFAWSHADRDRAFELVQALLSAGLDVWSDLLPQRVGSNDPIGSQIRAAIARSAGRLILLPRGPVGAWTEAEVNLALTHQASFEGYRVLLLAQEPAPALPPELKRFPIFPLPPQDGAETAPRILAELLPPQNLSPEPAGTRFVEAIRSPTERECR